jgi:hypothetical protein
MQYLKKAGVWMWKLTKAALMVIGIIVVALVTTALFLVIAILFVDEKTGKNKKFDYQILDQGRCQYERQDYACTQVEYAKRVYYVLYGNDKKAVFLLRDVGGTKPEVVWSRGTPG